MFYAVQFKIHRLFSWKKQKETEGISRASYFLSYMHRFPGGKDWFSSAIRAPRKGKFLKVLS